MDGSGLARYEWLGVELIVLGLLVAEFVSVRRSIRKDRERKRQDPKADPDEPPDPS